MNKWAKEIYITKIETLTTLELICISSEVKK